MGSADALSHFTFGHFAIHRAFCSIWLLKRPQAIIYLVFKQSVSQGLEAGRRIDRHSAFRIGLDYLASLL